MKKPAQIQILPDFLANQIAAGEVVQRPESVVKELVENSIDSGAKSVTIIVRDAGKSLIHIIDSGEGMSEEDLRLSIKRHATSKITTQKDLESILTFGFRGEALASISSVARLEIITNNTDDETNGRKLIAEPNKEPVIEPVVAAKGTQVIVRNIFYNVPARRKFLRTNITEFRHISDTAIKTALSNPAVRVLFYDDDTLIFDTTSTTLKETISEVLGESFLATLIEIEAYNQSEIEISGFLSEINSFRSTRTNQYIFLNGRPIKSKSLAHAIMTAYDPYHTKGQYPAYIINLKIDPSRVDINIHPQKHEVKFDHEKRVYDLVLNAVSKTLDTGGYIPSIHGEKTLPPSASLPHTSMKVDGKNVLVNQNTGEIVDTHNKWQNQDRERDYKPRKPNFERWDNTNSYKNDGHSVADLLYGGDSMKGENQPEMKHLSKDHYIFNNKYLFNYYSDSVAVVNIKAAMETLSYHKMLIEESEQSQTLIFPTSIPIKLEQNNAYEDILQLLTQFNVDIKRENDSYIIAAQPQFMSNIDINKLFIDLSNVQNVKKKDIARYIAKAISQNTKFSHQDITNINEFIRTNPELNLSPSGKRISKILYTETLDTWF